MPRWLFFVPIAGLTAFAAYLGLQAGSLPTETQIISRYANIYVANAGGEAARTDCSASPHPEEAVRIIIRCGRPGGGLFVYYVGPRGQQLFLDENGVPRT